MTMIFFFSLSLPGLIKFVEVQCVPWLQPKRPISKPPPPNHEAPKGEERTANSVIGAQKNRVKSVSVAFQSSSNKPLTVHHFRGTGKDRALFVVFYNLI